ncbi:two-component system chemotaxis response regulator CheY [Alkalibacillus flavidus]|uniref:Two-component system chemotaxis response regulator CheY n=1 Tax=Alkalibacillus flavidus TaxID=546021 RepID=A0ABV2KU32_9BACI
MSTILIADDSKFMRLHLKQTLLSHDKHEIIEASDGKEAIHLYKEYSPDLVILDITMKHMDGLTALKEIMGIDHHALVVMCSAMGTKYNVIESLQLGAADFIAKPNFDGLINVLDELERGE